jgi:chemotaxis protein MotB
MEEEQKCDEGAPGWVVTFGDMMSLLLTFFILLLSFASMEQAKFQVIASSMNKAFGAQNVTPRESYEDGKSPVMQNFAMPFKATEAVEQLKNIVAKQQSRSPQGKVNIKVEENHQGVLVTLGDEGLFESGKADIRPEIWPFLDSVAKLISENQSQVRVSAFTDDVPLKNHPIYASNEHLSAARAVAIIQYLQSAITVPIPAERFETAPFGPHRPITANIGIQNRMRNRRIEVLFYKRPSAQWKIIKGASPTKEEE